MDLMMVSMALEVMEGVVADDAKAEQGTSCRKCYTF